jgi:F-type H+-transporting ATPase subunit b
MRKHQRRMARTGKASPLLLFLFFLILVSGAFAQDNGSNSSDSGSSAASESQKSPDNSKQRRESVARELNRESRESAGEGENAQFKHSASVRWVSKATGLSVNQVYWLSVAVNFGVIAGVILWVSKKNLPAIFRNRTNQIQKAMEEARKASEEANRRLEEIAARLSHLDTEIAAMKSSADKEGTAEEARAQAAAQEEAHRIVETAEQEIASAAKLARRDLTAYAASLAVSLAEKQIEIAPSTDQALVTGFMKELVAEGSAGKSGR